jgi:integrase
VRSSTIASKRRGLEAFAAWLKADLNVADVSRVHTGRYVAHLMENGKAATTNRDTVSGLFSFFAWAIRRGFYTHANPWAGQAADLHDPRRGSAASNPRRAWRPEELKLMATSASRDDVRWQAAVIAMYSGMRLDEVASMKVSDVNLDEGFMAISEGKTTSSVRQVPTHPIIKRLIKRLTEESTDGYLLVGLKRSGLDNKRGHSFSKRLGRWIRNLGIEDTGVVFHSLRNTFINRAENAGVPVSTTNLITGHARQNLGYGLYSKGVELPVLQQAIKKVSYGDIDQIIQGRAQ